MATSIRAVDVIDLLQRVFRKHGAPHFLRSDNGSEFTAQEVQIWLEDHQTGPAFIPPGQPWNNGFIESFHDKFRDECLNREWFQSLPEAQVAIEKWRRHYNTQRPHSALGYTCTALARSASAGVKPRRSSRPQTQPSAESLISRGHKNRGMSDARNRFQPSRFMTT